MRLLLGIRLEGRKKVEVTLLAWNGADYYKSDSDRSRKCGYLKQWRSGGHPLVEAWLGRFQHQLVVAQSV